MSRSLLLANNLLQIPFTNLLISDADVTVNKLCGDDQFVILASDGFWDVIDNDLAVEFALVELHQQNLRKLTSLLSNFQPSTTHKPSVTRWWTWPTSAAPMITSAL